MSECRKKFEELVELIEKKTDWDVLIATNHSQHEGQLSVELLIDCEEETDESE